MAAATAVSHAQTGTQNQRWIVSKLLTDSLYPLTDPFSHMHRCFNRGIRHKQYKFFAAPTRQHVTITQRIL